jgi:hypothetical protein
MEGFDEWRQPDNLSESTDRYDDSAASGDEETEFSGHDGITADDSAEEDLEDLAPELAERLEALAATGMVVVVSTGAAGETAGQSDDPAPDDAENGQEAASDMSGRVPPEIPPDRKAGGGTDEPEDGDSKAPADAGRMSRLRDLLRKVMPAWSRLDGETIVPDKPYERKDLVRDPITGEQVPAMQLLDEVHHRVRVRELMRQATDPRPEAVPIPEREVPQRAFDLLMSLQDAATTGEWKVRGETLEDDTVLRTYSARQESLERPGRSVFFTAQLLFPDSESAVPLHGNLSVTEPSMGWSREFYFQAEPTPRERGDRPLIYYDDHPFHEEELGRPERNTQFALEQAQRMISQLMGRPRAT